MLVIRECYFGTTNVQPFEQPCVIKKRLDKVNDLLIICLHSKIEIYWELNFYPTMKVT